MTDTIRKAGLVLVGLSAIAALFEVWLGSGHWSATSAILGVTGFLAVTIPEVE